MCSNLKSLEEDASLLSLWFENDYMKLKEDKMRIKVIFLSSGVKTASYLQVFQDLTGKR